MNITIEIINVKEDENFVRVTIKEKEEVTDIFEKTFPKDGDIGYWLATVMLRDRRL